MLWASGTRPARTEAERKNVLKWIFARSYEGTESLRPAKDRRDLFMNLLSLYYFVELAKELHVTNTAQKLYISQQNLSQHIQRLEQYYGVPLFHRKPKLALTYAGEPALRCRSEDPRRGT